ncbi:MAG: MFS transporter [Dokdonella sp.]
MIARQPIRLVYATIFTLTAIEFMQLSMTAFAAGPIMGEVSIGPEDFSLIASVYASVAILMISMQRWFVERMGGRRFIQCITAISVLGSALCATSHDFDSFLAGRMVMAIGGGAMFTAARMIVHHVLEGRQRFLGIASLATGVALSIAAAPGLASLAVANETWTAIFWLLASLGVAAFLLASVTLSNDAVTPIERLSHINPWEQLLLVGSSFVLLYALQRFYYDFYGDVAWIAVAFCFAVAGLLAYANRQRRRERPLLHIRQMLHARYLVGMGLFMFAYLMLGANNYVVPVMLQRTLGYSWETVGHFEALGLGFAVLTWAVMSQVLPRYPAPRKFYVTGFVALAGFGFLLTRIDTSANLWLDVLPALALNSVFLLTVLPVTAMQTFRETEYDESVFSNAQQLKNMLAQAGIALGITLATLGQQWRTTVHYATLNTNIHPGNPAFTAMVEQIRNTLAPAIGPTDAAQIAMARIAQMLAQQSSMLANIDHFGVIAVLGVLGVIFTIVQRVMR